MIRFSLHCEHDHEFEAWFRGNDDFDTQKKRGFVECPECGSRNVGKALMAPAVSTGRRKEKIALAMGEAQKRAMAQLKELSEKMRENAENVGDKFAEEARRSTSARSRRAASTARRRRRRQRASSRTA